MGLTPSNNINPTDTVLNLAVRDSEHPHSLFSYSSACFTPAARSEISNMFTTFA